MYKIYTILIYIYINVKTILRNKKNKKFDSLAQ